MTPGKTVRHSAGPAAWFLALGCWLGAAQARAQDTEPPATAAGATHTESVGEAHRKGWSLAHVNRPHTLPAGEIQVFAPVQFSLSAGEVAQPVFVAPNVSVGVTDRLTLRLLHSEAYRAPSDVAGLCLTGTSGGCPRLYDNVSADAQLALWEAGPFSLVGSAGLSLARLDPLLAGATFGSVAEVELGERFTLQVEPALFVGLNRRGSGNVDRLGATARLFDQVAERWLMFALTGFYAALDRPKDTAMVPVGAGVVFAALPKVDLGLQLTFTRVGGRGASLDERQLSILTAFRL